MRQVPVDAKRADWPRLVADAINRQAGQFVNLGNYADDAAAATGGVQVGGFYRNGSVLMVRVA